MAKITAWLMTVLGVLLVLAAPGVGVVMLSDAWAQWAIALIVLVIGVTKLVRNYSYSKRK